MKNTSLIKPEPIQKAKLIKLAVDVHANSYTFCRQLDNAQLQPPQKMNPVAFVSWAVKQKSLAERVVVCYESGPFGFVLARELMAKGVECIVMAAQQLDERRKRVQTDKLDTLQIASRLDRYLAGNTRALCAVKIPTVEQERKRSEGRQRGQWRKTRHQLAAQGRSLLVLNGYTSASMWWWRDNLWVSGEKCWPAAIVTLLARWRAVLLSLEEQLNAITKEVEQSLPQHLPASYTQITHRFGSPDLGVIESRVAGVGAL
jgi:transposase